MKILYAQPPPKQREGGLEKAIRGWERALKKAGAQVELLERDEQLATDCVVHFHGLWQPAHSRWSAICRKRGIKYIVSPHGMLEPWAWRHKWWKKWPYYIWREHGHLAGANALAAASEMEAKNLRRHLPQNKVEVATLGIDPAPGPDYAEARKKLMWKQDETVILFLSRIDPKKGIDLLLSALHQTRAQWSAKLRVVIAGEGEAGYRIRLQRWAQWLKIPMEWAGGKNEDEKWIYFQGADLFCLPTRSENFGYAILEACLTGTPVLTTTTTPWGVLEEKGFGWVARPEPGELAGKLKEFFKSPRVNEKKRQILAEWARENYLWDKVAAAHLKLHRNL